MASHTITWSEYISHPWLEMEPCRIGDTTAGLGTPARYLLLAHDGVPILRVDAFLNSNECFAFSDATVWHDHLVIGWGERAYLLDLDSRDIVWHELGSYFGHFYANRDYLLVASDERIQRIAPDGSLLWQSDVLGIDGVVVDAVDGNMIHGTGEWDPPGEWQPFQIRLDSGQAD